MTSVLCPCPSETLKPFGWHVPSVLCHCLLSNSFHGINRSNADDFLDDLGHDFDDWCDFFSSSMNSLNALSGINSLSLSAILAFFCFKTEFSSLRAFNSSLRLLRYRPSFCPWLSVIEPQIRFRASERYLAFSLL